MKNTTRLLAAVAMIACALPVAAQDYSADPTYGTVNLSSGFPEDPYGVSLSSGGSRDASNLGGNCTGYIANAPDVRLNYDAGSLPLYIYAGSSADTTLVINAPDGSWHCDDDSRGALDPVVYFSNPMSGQYDIWVGTYASNDLHRAELYLSELGAD
jgi:hypothetical protein